VRTVKGGAYWPETVCRQWVIIQAHARMRHFGRSSDSRQISVIDRLRQRLLPASIHLQLGDKTAVDICRAAVKTMLLIVDDWRAGRDDVKWSDRHQCFQTTTTMSSQTYSNHLQSTTATYQYRRNNNNNKWRWWMWTVAANRGTRSPVLFRVGGRWAQTYIHQMNQVNCCNSSGHNNGKNKLRQTTPEYRSG